MHQNLIPPFIEATLSVLNTMGQIECYPGKVVEKVGTKTYGCLTGAISMTDPQVTGTLTVSFDEPTILQTVSNMFMEEFKEISPEIVDAVGEITNMICGAAKTTLSTMGYNFDMTTPFVITGQNIEMKQLSKSKTYSIPFSSVAGCFVIELSFVPTTAASKR